MGILARLVNEMRPKKEEPIILKITIDGESKPFLYKVPRDTIIVDVYYGEDMCVTLNDKTTLQELG